jgi:hypothetical protein
MIVIVIIAMISLFIIAVFSLTYARRLNFYLTFKYNRRRRSQERNFGLNKGKFRKYQNVILKKIL